MAPRQRKLPSLSEISLETKVGQLIAASGG
jgi:hypothetical protein